MRLLLLLLLLLLVIAINTFHTIFPPGLKHWLVRVTSTIPCVDPRSRRPRRYRGCRHHRRRV
jgi:hypothetical protein